MEKILTISIAAYNVEDYIEKSILSCVSDNSIDDIEILIMNDGSSDKTPDIAQKYVDMYPGSVTLINKVNGGYGTNVNMALELAKGKYFRLLDGDDFLDEGSIDKYVDVLKKLNDDIIVTGVNYFYDNENKKEYKVSTWDAFNGKRLTIDNSMLKLPIPMWNITVKTECVKRHFKSLPKHTLYTDQLFIYYAFIGSKSIAFFNFPVYCYRIGREGQSIEDSQRMKHWKDMCRVFNVLLNDYSKRNTTNPLMDKRAEVLFSHVIRTFLLFEYNKKWLIKIKDYNKKVKRKSKKLYKNTWWSYKRITILRLTGFLAYRFLAGKRKNETNRLY